MWSSKLALALVAFAVLVAVFAMLRWFAGWPLYSALFLPLCGLIVCVVYPAPKDFWDDFYNTLQRIYRS